MHRSCTTYWPSIWPDMRIIHVMRHGVDVAASLNTRSNRNWDADSDRFEKWLPIYRWRRASSHKEGSRAQMLRERPRFLGGTGKHRELDNWSKEEVLRIRFEDILSQPEMKISEIAEFKALR